MRLFLPSGIMLSWSHSGRERQGGKEEEAAVSEAEEKNKALVCRFFEEVFKRGNLGVADELLAADFAWKLPGKDAGIEDYEQWVAEQLASSSDLHFSIEEQIAEGEKVVTRLIGSGTHDQQEFGEFTPRGVRITIEAIIIHRVVEGKIVEERNKADFSPFWQQRLEQERIERERAEQEIRVARGIQQASLPKEVPTLEGWKISPLYQPAREVGGDFYDFHLLSEAGWGLWWVMLRARACPQRWSCPRPAGCSGPSHKRRTPPRRGRCSNESTKRSFQAYPPTCSSPASTPSSTQRAAPCNTPTQATTRPTCAVATIMLRS